jgi:hypothetical protein
MKFWTCGPFKEAEDKLELMSFLMTRQVLFEEIIKELGQIDNLIEHGAPDEKLLASMMKPQIEAKLYTILGIQDGDGQTESNEVPRKTVLESISRITKD